MKQGCRHCCVAPPRAHSFAWGTQPALLRASWADIILCEHEFTRGDRPKSRPIRSSKTGTVVASPLAFISMTESFGGHEVMLARWLKELTDQGEVKPILISAENAKVKAAVQGLALGSNWIKARPVVAEKLLGPLKKIATLTHLVRQFARIRRETGARNAVVSEGSLMAEPLSTIAARVVFHRVHVYVPMVESFHALGYPEPDGATKRFMRIYRWLPHSWITLSSDHAAIFRNWSGVKQTVHVLRNTTIDGIESAGPRGATFPSPQEEIKVLVLGRLTAHHKGLDLLLAHAQKHVSSLQARKIRFRLVGDGEYKQTILKAIADDQRLSKVLELAPWSAPLEAYRQADCVLLASRIEGVPLVMLEAMALGIPIVASDLPGTRGYLPTECLFPIGDLQRAVNLIEQLRDPAFLTACVMKNRDRYKAEASASAFSENTRQLARQLVA